MLILQGEKDYFRRNYDEKDTTGDFDTLFDQRPIVDAGLKLVYMKLLAMVRQQAEPREV